MKQRTHSPSVIAIALSDGHLSPTLSKYEPYLTVCDGCAAFFTEGNVALLNLVDLESKPQMQVFCFTSLLGINLKFSNCIALTPTTLLVAPVYIKPDARNLVCMDSYASAQEGLGPFSLGEYSYGPLWVDFVQMRRKLLPKWRQGDFKRVFQDQVKSQNTKNKKSELSHFISEPTTWSQAGKPPDEGNTTRPLSEEYLDHLAEEMEEDEDFWEEFMMIEAGEVADE
ncbi:unnamed protein product [Sympodiomycopsis kandeliae]